MTWSDIPFKPTTKALRQFAAAWLIFFLAFGAHQYLVRRHPSVGLALMGMAIVVGLLGLAKPSAVRWIFVGWMVVAFPIGWLLSALMLLLMFYGIHHAGGGAFSAAGPRSAAAQARPSRDHVLDAQGDAAGCAQLFPTVLKRTLSTMTKRMKEQQQSDFEKAAKEQHRGGFLREVGGFLAHNKKWWLLPILITLLLFGLLILLSGTGLAPFIYTLF